MFATPSTLAEAFALCDYLLARPNSVVVKPGQHTWSIFRRLCLETKTRGPRVTDAWFAALAIEHDWEWSPSTATTPASPA